MDNASYQIKGGHQNRPSNWPAALRNSKFKESLMLFLVDFWKEDDHAVLLGPKVLYVNCNDVCFKYSSINGKVLKEDVPELYSTQEEADGRMFFHLSTVQHPANVLSRTADRLPSNSS